MEKVWQSPRGWSQLKCFGVRKSVEEQGRRRGNGEAEQLVILTLDAGIMEAESKRISRQNSVGI
jgi:hypothetical protein